MDEVVVAAPTIYGRRREGESGMARRKGSMKGVVVNEAGAENKGLTQPKAESKSKGYGGKGTGEICTLREEVQAAGRVRRSIKATQKGRGKEVARG